MAAGDLDDVGQDGLGEAHAVGLPYQVQQPGLRLGTLDGQLDFEAQAAAFLGACQDRALLAKMGQHPDALVSEFQFFDGRSLRHLGEQSEGHAGHEIGQGCGGGPFAPGQIFPLIADQGELANPRRVRNSLVIGSHDTIVTSENTVQVPLFCL